MGAPPGQPLPSDETYRLRMHAEVGRYREADRVVHELRLRSHGERSRVTPGRVVATAAFTALCLALLYVLTATLGDGIDHFAPLLPVAIAAGAGLGWRATGAVRRLRKREVGVRFEGANGVLFGDERLGPLVRVEADPVDNLLRLEGEDWSRELVMGDPESPVRVAAMLQEAVVSTSSTDESATSRKEAFHE